MVGTIEDREQLKYILKVFFIAGTGHDIDGVTPEEFAPLVKHIYSVYGEDNLQPIFREATSAGRDEFAASAQNLFPPGSQGTVDPNVYEALGNNIDLVMQRYNL
jgi:hypothetical protein